MLIYNTDGTVSEIVVKGIFDGKVTSSLVTPPTIQQTFEASASNALIVNAITAGSSSAQAVGIGYSTSTNTSNLGYTYKSSATVQKTYSTSSYSVLNPTSTDLHTRGMRRVATIPANTSLMEIVEERLALDISTPSLKDGSLSPKFNTIASSKFTTTYSNGTVLVIGDDSKIVDVNLGNGMAIVGQQQSNRGWVKFGTSGPVWGHNGNQAALPAPGDGLYAVTGSLLVSASKLLFYNGSGASGWAVLK